MYAALNLDSIGRLLATVEHARLFGNEKAAPVNPSRAPGEVNAALQHMERFFMLPFALQQMCWGKCTISREFVYNYNRKKKNVQVRLDVQLSNSFEAVSWVDNGGRWQGPTACVMAAGYISQWATK